MLAVAVCLAYVIGCLSPGWWLVRRATGGDLRQTGSGGTGATNAARVLGPGAFIAVLLLDAGKAAVAVLLGAWIARQNAWHVLSLPAVVAGHIWPAPLGFKGGRGAGPLLGGLAALNPLFLVAGALPAALVAVFTRRMFAITTAAMCGGIVATAWLVPEFPARIAVSTAIAFVLFAHRSHFLRVMHRAVP